jgi:hypothetical protein
MCPMLGKVATVFGMINSRKIDFSAFLSGFQGIDGTVLGTF